MTKKFMTDPIRILVKRDELTLEGKSVRKGGSFFKTIMFFSGIKQFFVAVEKEEWKFDTLCDL